MTSVTVTERGYRKATVTQIATLHMHGEQKSISGLAREELTEVDGQNYTL